MSDTVFGKILDGEIPCHRVYEDDLVLAFLDVGPLADGHTLVIPKERKADLHELSDESAAALGRVLPRLCRAVLAATGATDYNVLAKQRRRRPPGGRPRPLPHHPQAPRPRPRHRLAGPLASTASGARSWRRRSGRR